MNKSNIRIFVRWGSTKFPKKPGIWYVDIIVLSTMLDTDFFKTKYL